MSATLLLLVGSLLSSTATSNAGSEAVLRENIQKVDLSIEETERMISRSMGKPFLPDLHLRLCELYVEKSRYVYHLHGAGSVSPEAKLLKEKAIRLYDELLRDFPGYAKRDVAFFYLAHEQRELGLVDEMLKTLDELVRKHPKSPLRFEAEQIIGDHFFDKSNLDEAEKHYRLVLSGPEAPVQDLARYKLGWIRVNKGDHKGAARFFEAAVRSRHPKGSQSGKQLGVKREALLDLAFSYTEVHEGKNALPYFERLSDSRATYALVLEKLASRYSAKQQFALAAESFRTLLRIQRDPSMDVERVQRLYDALQDAKGKMAPTPEDVEFVVRAATQVRLDNQKSPADKLKQLSELEEMGRDLSTQLHVQAKKTDRRKDWLAAASAYEAYLSFFRPEAHVRKLMRNRADALFAAEDFTRAGRQYEALARLEEGRDKGAYESALYGSLASYKSSLGSKRSEKLTSFQFTDARQALKHLGYEYVEKFPRHARVPEVQFNIARAPYEDGELDRAAELFTTFALAHSAHKDATVAGHLALDSLRRMKSHTKLAETGRKLVKSKLPESFRAEAKQALALAEEEALHEMVLAKANETGDVITGLVQAADENAGKPMGEKALYAAVLAAREKRALDQERELTERFLRDYPQSTQGRELLVGLARRSAEAGRFDEAATWFERSASRSQPGALEDRMAAARLQLELQDHPKAIKNLELALSLADDARRASLRMMLAEAHWKAKDAAQARSQLRKVLEQDGRNAQALALLAEMESQSGEVTDQLVGRLRALARDGGDSTNEIARGLWFASEPAFKAFQEIPPEELEEKAATFQALQAQYVEIASLGSPDWVLASLWRIAAGLEHLSQAMEDMPVPDGASDEEAAAFEEAVAQQAAALKAQADEAYQACISRAEGMGVYTPAVLGCRTRKSNLDVRPPVLKTSADGKVPAEVLTLAAKNPDATALEKLGLAYLQAGQLSSARLALSRAVETQESLPAAQTALGFTLLLSGDPTGAALAYGKALELDAGFDRARLNLASLKCRVGDREGARSEAARIQRATSISGPDVDQEWKRCIDAVSHR